MQLLMSSEAFLCTECFSITIHMATSWRMCSSHVVLKSRPGRKIARRFARCGQAICMDTCISFLCDDLKINTNISISDKQNKVPLWVLVWVFRCWLVENDLEQPSCVHWYGFVPLGAWAEAVWALSWWCFENDSSQSSFGHYRKPIKWLRN